ncbi:MAG: glycosyltransferase family 2 protein [Pseudomonadota bacterium]
MTMDDNNPKFSKATPATAELGIVIVNYRTPKLIIDCLASLGPQLAGVDARVAIVDNASGDGSAEAIGTFLGANDANWKNRVFLIQSETNSGFSGGNNLGLSYLSAPYYLLLNSDTLVRERSLEALLASASDHETAGIIAPRLEDPDGTPQQSVFRTISPLTEFASAATFSLFDKLFPGATVSRPVPAGVTDADWVSFACVLLRHELLTDIGTMDEGYFMYFEDTDYCLSAKRAGWRVIYDPSACVVHLRGGSSPVKKAIRENKRPPAYFYASRTRYFRKTFGVFGPTIANAAWLAGRAVSSFRVLVGRKKAPVCKNQHTDIWLNWRNPLGNNHAPASH